MSNADVQLEPDRVAKVKIALIAVAALLITLVSILVSYLILLDAESDLPSRAPIAETRPAPREISGVFQTQIDRDRLGLRMREEAKERLTRFEWVDQERQIIRIPVDAAIELYLEETRRTQDE